MNRLLSSHLVVVVIFLFVTVFSPAAEVRTYQLTFPDGSTVPTTIVWDNINGLDNIRGNFHFAAGDLGFSGKNSASGFIWMNDEHGTYYELRKETAGKGFRWVGKNGGGQRIVLVPTATGSSNSMPVNAPGSTVRHYQYIPEGGGTPFHVSMVWENIKGLGAISGTITYPNGVVSFSGRNPESGYITFTASDGAVYELWRRSRGSGFEWNGTGADAGSRFEVTLVPSDQAPAPKPAPGNGETTRQYTMTGPYGQKHPATIIWSNIKGLGPIKGLLFSPGEELTVNGQNSRSGFIYFNDQYGTYYELDKQDPIGGKTFWKGKAQFNDGSTRPIALQGH
ncbi:MAG: hypothetical protein P1U68_03695 [Verrucomicrobiales bacterium]|nr:hypothetical protein [Verrucomicrobiales bacterium]